jgi:hypothetical protein
MSKKAIEAALGKALLDDTFRRCLFAEPDNALEGFDLTGIEKARLKHLDSETLDELARVLQTRLIKTRQSSSHIPPPASD